MSSFPCISHFHGTSYKNVKDTATSCFTLVFTSADNIFHHTLEFIQHYLKKDFRQKFSLQHICAKPTL